MSQQGVRLAVLNSGTSERFDYNGAWMYRAAVVGVSQGDYNGRLLAWINLRYGQNYTDLPGAMAYMASVNGATNFSSMGTFVLT